MAYPLAHREDLGITIEDEAQQFGAPESQLAYVAICPSTFVMRVGDKQQTVVCVRAWGEAAHAGLAPTTCLCTPA